MIEVLNDIMIALVLRRLHRRRFDVTVKNNADDYNFCVLDAGGYKVEALVDGGGGVTLCGPNNRALKEAFDPIFNRADSLWLAQTIKDRINEQADEESNGL